MATAYVHYMLHGGAETLVNQLAGTPVAAAGRSGRVRVGFVSTLPTTTGSLKGRKSGKSIIPEGSHAVPTGPVTALQLDSRHVFYDAHVNSEEELDLEIIAAAAASTLVLVIVD